MVRSSFGDRIFALRSSAASVCVTSRRRGRTATGAGEQISDYFNLHTITSTNSVDIKARTQKQSHLRYILRSSF